ncbi:MAG: hypothetical protein HC892_12860 [Saprospiraceae bacterium]|nr:hypothetical protein [Saprospiraceae bacterium]
MGDKVLFYFHPVWLSVRFKGLVLASSDPTLFNHAIKKPPSESPWRGATPKTDLSIFSSNGS